jgi:hypothetical protein
LASFPEVTLRDRLGGLLTLPAIGYGDDGYFPSRPNGGVSLEPGVAIGAASSAASRGQAVLKIETWGAGRVPTPIASMDIMLPDGAGRLVERFSPPWSGCQGDGCLPPWIEISSFQLPDQPSPPPPPTQFAVSYHAPPQARLGTNLSYTVTLTNVSGHEITLEHCPGYSESLLGMASLERHLLNCGTVRTFRAAESHTFAMELLLPATAAATLTSALLSWIIDLPNVSENASGQPRVEIVAR